MINFFLLLFQLSLSRKNNPIVNNYLKQLGEHSSKSKEEQAIIWSLAELAHQVDKFVSTDEVETEISEKIDEILERVKIANRLLKEDSNSIREKLTKTKRAMKKLILNSKEQIRDDMNLFKDRVLESVEDFFEIHDETQKGKFKRIIKRIKKLFKIMRFSSTMWTFIFFALFQVLLVLGIIYYKKLDAQLRIFL